MIFKSLLKSGCVCNMSMCRVGRMSSLQYQIPPTSARSILYRLASSYTVQGYIDDYRTLYMRQDMGDSPPSHLIALLGGSWHTIYGTVCPHFVNLKYMYSVVCVVITVIMSTQNIYIREITIKFFCASCPKVQAKSIHVHT